MRHAKWFVRYGHVPNPMRMKQNVFEEANLWEWGAPNSELAETEKTKQKDKYAKKGAAAPAMDSAMGRLIAAKQAQEGGDTEATGKLPQLCMPV